MDQYILFDIYSHNLFTEYPENAKFFALQSPKCRLEPQQSIISMPAQNTRDVTPVPEMRPSPFLRATLCDRPRHPSQGWVFGSNPESCDIVIGKHSDGISGTQFSLSPQLDPGRLIMRNLSRNGTYVEEEAADEVEYVPVMNQRGISDSQSLVIVLGSKTRMTITSYEQHGDLYTRRWAELYADMNRDGPTLETLKIIPEQACTYISPYILKSLISNNPDFTYFSAIERQSHCPVVLKRYSAFHRERADREASLLSSVQHGHIIALRGYDRDYGLAFTHFNGRSLLSEHKHSPLTYGEFKIVMRQILDALQHLHGLTLYHGDFRPENIVVRQRMPTIDVALLNFDTCERRASREHVIWRDMDNFLLLLSHFLCGGQESRYEGGTHDSSVRQIFSSFATARYDAIADNATHSGTLLKDDDFNSILNDVSLENAAVLPLLNDQSNGCEQASLPDTEPWGDSEKSATEIFFYTQGRRHISVKKTGEIYELNLRELLRAARLPRGQRTTLVKKYTGVSRLRQKHKESHWIPLTEGIEITETLGMDVPKALRRLERHVTGRKRHPAADASP